MSNHARHAIDAILESHVEARQEWNNYCNAIDAILGEMIDGDDWRELRSCADTIQEISLILNNYGFGPVEATLKHVPKVYEVTVREYVQVVRTRKIEAPTVEAAREQAEAEDWRTWHTNISEVTNAEIEHIEEIGEV